MDDGKELEQISEGQEIERAPVGGREVEAVSMAEIEGEDAVSLPNKEVLSLLDVNANVDLGLDLAAPVDLAAAANLNVAAPIEAAASANVLSDGANAVAVSQQSGSLEQTISGTADATAHQDAAIAQDSSPDDAATGGATDAAAGATDAAGATTAAGTGDVVGGTVDGATGTVDGATGTVGDVVDGTTGDVVGGVTDGTGGTVGDVVDGASGGTGDVVGGVTDGTGDVVGGVTDGVGDAVDGASGGVDSLLSGGSLLEANVDIDANANLTAPIDGAVAANANIAAPINAAVSANIGSDGATAQALADQDLQISQHLDNVEATADAEQNADISQQ